MPARLADSTGTDVATGTGIPVAGSRLGLAVDVPGVARARERLPSADDAARLTSLLSLMADPVRLRILYALDVSTELCVGDLALALEANEDQVTYALRLLRTAGLVVARKSGRVVYNRLASDFPEPLREHCMRQLIEITRRVADGPEG